jgi:hypothetical protein
MRQIILCHHLVFRIAILERRIHSLGAGCHVKRRTTTLQIPFVRLVAAYFGGVMLIARMQAERAAHVLLWILATVFSSLIVNYDSLALRFHIRELYSAASSCHVL